MNKTHKIILLFSLHVFLISALSSRSYADTKLHPNDVARFLAGLEVNASSPLYKYTQSNSWQRHAKTFDKAWTNVEASKLKEARLWANQSLNNPQATMFYMFSGPDYLYANTFFPRAKVYVLSGLEPVGRVPQINKISTNSVNYSLAQLRHSLNTVLNYSFFITKRMKEELKTGFKGTVPIMLVFMARSGKVIKDVSYVSLKKDGTLIPLPENSKKAATAVKITFNSGEAEDQTLYYFSTNLANYGVRKSGFLKFCDRLGQGDSLVKSASYLMHMGAFSDVRNFLLKNSSVILQDDSGIPIRHFSKKQWDLLLHGRYRGPIELFQQHYQRDLAHLYRTSNPEKVKFGIGYRWRTYETNFLLAKRNM